MRIEILDPYAGCGHSCCDGRDFVKVVEDPALAAAEAEKNKWFASCVDEGIKPFWRAVLHLASGEIKTEPTDLYKFGSAWEPCRDGATIFGRVCWQDLETSIAWGATEEEAVRRVKRTYKEARKRAARDKAYDEVEKQAMAALPDWDPYGLWLTQEWRDKLKAESQAAYEGAE